MRIIITGTPGTGKTSVSKRLHELTKLPVIHLNEVIIKEKIYKEYDDNRETYVVDMDKMERFCEKLDNVIIEGHLSHYCMKNDDIIIVLRANPLVLKKRLRQKKYNEKKIMENVEAEVIDVVLQEVLDLAYNKDVEIYEIDTSDKTIDRISIIIKNIIEDKEYAKNFLPGKVDYTNYLLEGKYL